MEMYVCNIIGGLKTKIRLISIRISHLNELDKLFQFLYA